MKITILTAITFLIILISGCIHLKEDRLADFFFKSVKNSSGKTGTKKCGPNSCCCKKYHKQTDDSYNRSNFNYTFKKEEKDCKNKHEHKKENTHKNKESKELKKHSVHKDKNHKGGVTSKLADFIMKKSGFKGKQEKKK